MMQRDVPSREPLVQFSLGDMEVCTAAMLLFPSQAMLSCLASCRDMPS
jgi:hypothetical protein